jgi:uncharacterized protein YggE
VTPKGFFAVLGAVVLLLAAGGIYSVVRPPKAHGGATPSQVITVTGTGVVTTTPDRANFSFGVQTERDKAAAAMAATAARLQKVIDTLKGKGVQPSEIQTQYISISQHWEVGSVVGYIASNSVVARIRDLSRAGILIDAAVDAGANSVNGPSFYRADSQELAKTALRAAVADARAKARAIAAASGVSLGRVLAVIESGAVQPSSGTTGGTTGTTSITSVPTPVLPGEQAVSSTISVTFAAP